MIGSERIESKMVWKLDDEKGLGNRTCDLEVNGEEGKK